MAKKTNSGPRKATKGQRLRSTNVSRTRRAGRKVKVPKIAASRVVADTKGRKTLAGHLVAIDELCDEITQRMRIWAFEDLAKSTIREKCCADLETLQQWAESTVEQHKAVVRDLGPSGDVVITQALQTLRQRGCGALLQGVEILIAKLISRMKYPMSEEDYRKFGEAFTALARLTQQIQLTSQIVSRDIRNGQGRAVLTLTSPNLVSSLDIIADLLSSMVLNVQKTQEHDATAKVSGDEVLAKQRTQADGIKAAYKAVIPKLQALVDSHNDAIAARDKTLALNIQHLLEDLGCAVGNYELFLEHIALIEHAATRLDDGLDSKANELRTILDEIRGTLRELGLLMDGYRERIKLASFRFIRRRGMLPQLEQLPAMDRRVFETVMRLNHDDPEPQFFTTTRQRIEVEIGDPSKNPSIERSLTALCTKWRLIGRRPTYTSTHQLIYFVFTDAFAFYAATVRPIGLGYPKAP